MVLIAERDPIWPHRFEYANIRGVPMAEILLGGGTPFSSIIDGYRVGGNETKNLSAFLGWCYTDLRGIVSSFGIEVYDGLSEDLTEEKLETMSDRIVSSINDHPQTRTFLLSSGSDNLEGVGRFLSNKLDAQLHERDIAIYIFWSNSPIERDKFGQLTLRTAITATREKRPGGVYLASGHNIIPASLAAKESYHGVDMKLFDVTDKEAAYWENRRRDFVGRQSAELAFRFFGMSILDLLEQLGDPNREVRLSFPAKDRSRIIYSGNVDVTSGSNLWDLATNRTRHIQDKEGLVVVKHLNNFETVYTGQYDRAKALLIVLNHSATTSLENAQRLNRYFYDRKNSGNPVLIFAVTENGEPKQWTIDDGIYPSGEILKSISILLREDVKTAHIKLLASYYDELLKAKPGVDLEKIIAFMTTNHIGEFLGTLLTSQVQAVRDHLLDIEA